MLTKFPDAEKTLWHVSGRYLQYVFNPSSPQPVPRRRRLDVGRDSAAPSRDVAPSASMENLYPPSSQDHYNQTTPNPTLLRQP